MMEHDFWHQRWHDNEIGFHQEEAHPLLDRFWDSFAVPPDSRVLVPLCGKSLDMMLLRRRGHEVVGIELSEVAIDAFCEEHGLHLDRIDTPWGHRRVGDGFDLLVGDIFSINAFDVGRCAAVYDRAALVALPPVMRLRYAHQLARIVATGTPMLTIVFEHDDPVVQGPPFSVSEQEVRELFPEFRVTRIAEQCAALRGLRVRELALRLDPRS